jgi:large repetitive protein
MKMAAPVQKLATINAVPDAPEVPVLAAVQPDCDNPLGSIEVTSPLGTEYTYSIDGTTFQADPLFADLIPGDYTITVKNEDGCTSAEIITINAVPDAPEVPVLAAVQPDCDNPLGSIEVTSPLGADYTYSIDGTTFQSEPTVCRPYTGRLHHYGEK